MHIQDAADFAVEVHFATLNTASEENAGVYLENPAGQSKAIRMYQTANANMVADFHFYHALRLRKIPEDKQKLCCAGCQKGKNFHQGNDEFLFKHRLTIATLFPSFDLSSHGEICGKLMYSPAVAGAVCDRRANW
jgi:hypothetical protein